MDAEQWARVKAIFNAALDQPDDARPAFVRDASAGDEAVRAEVERLLEARHKAAGFLEQPAASAGLSGRVIGHYVIGRLLGSGGMGHVFAARDVALERDVALKVASFEGEDAQSSLRREAQHASRLSHPNICHIYDVGEDDGQTFIVMELLPGQSLADLLRAGPLPPADTKRYGMDIADALAHAHEQGILHRDLKSTNVIVTPRQGAKVLDFGLARTFDAHQIDALSHSQRSLTDEGTIAGTLPYMAPELLRGQRGDQRADIWALGVLLYEMVTGRRPFSGVTGFELSAAILHEPPRVADLPAALRPIVERCLAKAPADRYQRAADVHRALASMDAPDGAARVLLPAVPKRLISRTAKFLAGLAVAALVVWAIRSASLTVTFDNIQGYSLLEAGSFDRAIAEFQGAANQSPNAANAWDSLGEGYLAAGMGENALEAYSRALAIDPTFEASKLGRGLALASLGRYDEALRQPSPDFRVQAFLLSRVGRYREAMDVLATGRRADDDAEVNANALITSAWLFVEQKQYARALEDLRVAEAALLDRPKHSLLVLGDLIGGIAEIGAGSVRNAIDRLASLKSRLGDDRVEANWAAALEGEIALAEGQYDRAMSSFAASRAPAWMTLGRDASTVFAANLPSRDGPARVELARGNRAAAIAEYRSQTVADEGKRPAGVVEPRYILALARLLNEQGDTVGARAEYGRFLALWANADSNLAELAEARQALSR